MKSKISKSIQHCTRTFKCWLVEIRNLSRKIKKELPDLTLERAKMFYNGGYSPKMVVNEELRIPIGWEEI